MKLFSLRLRQVLGVAIALSLAFQLVGTIRRNYELSQQVNDLQQQIANLQADNAALSYKIQYYQTDSFKEKEARAALGLQAPGENVIILPPATSPIKESAAPQPKPASNWRQWVDFLFGSGASY